MLLICDIRNLQKVLKAIIVFHRYYCPYHMTDDRNINLLKPLPFTSSLLYFLFVDWAMLCVCDTSELLAALKVTRLLINPSVVTINFRCYKYLKGCAGTRFIAVTGFFISIPAFLLGRCVLLINVKIFNLIPILFTFKTRYFEVTPTVVWNSRCHILPFQLYCFTW